MAKEKYSLREKKYAKTKINLTKAFIERLKTTPFAEISIKDVCREAEVSEATFYNYFPQKLDVISYFQQLNLLKVEWQAAQNKGRLTPLEIIEVSFDSFAQTIKQPYLFYEIVSVFTAKRTRPGEGSLTAAEKFYAFPRCPGIEVIEVKSLDNFFSKYIKQAKAEKQIDKKIAVKDIMIILKSILVGVPLAIEIEEFNKLPRIFKRQLGLFKKSFALTKNK
jgi:AraC-like DNA-binding protein